MIRKLGLAPIQRDGLEHEFDVVGELDHANTLVVSKTRCPELQGVVIEKPGAELAEVLAAWLRGADRMTPPANPPPAPGKNGERMSPAQHRAFEAMITKNGLDRVNLHKYLVEIGWLEITPTGPHLTDLSPTHGSYILGNWEKMALALKKWEEKEAEGGENEQQDLPWDAAEGGKECSG